MRTFAALTLASLALAGSPPQDEFERQKNTAMVRIHPKLDQLVVKADALVKEGRFAAALEIYADCEKYPNHVVPIGDNPNVAKQYLGVLEYCMRKVGEWPDEGHAAYRAHYDPIAGQAFQKARDAHNVAGLSDIVVRYPWSSFADDALALLGALHLEAGRYSQAVDALERVLKFPRSDAKKEILFARLGSAYAGSGRRDKLAELVGRAEREAGNATIVRGENPIALAAYLKELLKTATPPNVLVTSSSSWEMIQGNPNGVRIAEATEFGSHAWSANIPATSFDDNNEQWSGMRVHRQTAAFLPIVPAVSDGIVYFHSDYSAYAYNLYSGITELLWTHRIEPPPGDLYFEDRLVHSTSIQDGRVFVNLITALGTKEVQMNYIPVVFPFPKRALFCLDAYTGKVQWRVGGVLRAMNDTSVERFEDLLTFATAPTPHGGLLYVGAVRQKRQTDPFDHYVTCIDPTNGRIRWSTFVASGGTEINLFGNSTRESLGSPVSVDEESVYYVTNHGALAALERTTGRLRWVYKYQQLAVNPTRRIDVRTNMLEWLPSAPVVAGNQVLFTPTDSTMLYALNGRTGELRWERRRGDARSVAGSDGNLVILAGDGLEWYDVGAEGKLIGRFEPQHGRACGRATVAADGIYFPTSQGLYRVPVTLRGTPNATFTPWPGARTDGGNVVAAEGAVVVVGNDSIEAFFNKKDMEKMIEQELLKSPDNASVVYQAALRLLQSGKDERACELFRRVVELVGKSPRPEEARLERAARKRLYSVALEAGRFAMSANNFPAARASYKKARDMAPDIGSVIEATAGIGEASLALRDFETAVVEFQRLLLDHGPEQVGGQRVFDLARGRIAAILEAGGREAYRKIEKEADQRLQRATADGAPDQLVDIFRTYPNSVAAERAVLAAADAFVKLGKSEDAAITLRLFLREFPGSERCLEAQAQLVQILEKRTLFSAAATVLRKMLRSSAEGEVTIEGRRVKVKEFAESRLAREEYKRSATAVQPCVIRPPLSKMPVYVEKEFPEGGSVLSIEGPALQRGAGLAFLNFSQAVKAIKPQDGKEIWRIPIDLPVKAAFSFEDALIFCTDASIVRVNPATGAVEWKHTPGSLIKSFLVTGSSLCYLGTDPAGRGASTLFAIDASRGSLSWSQSFEGIAIPRLGLLAIDDFVAVVTTSPNGNRIQLFESDSGRRGSSIAAQSQSSTMNGLGIVDGLLVLHTPGRLIECIELPAGKAKWNFRLNGLDVFLLKMSRAGVFVAAGMAGEDQAMVLDLRNGKRKAFAEKLNWDGGTAGIDMDEKIAVVATRMKDHSVVLRALDMNDTRLTELWHFKIQDGGLFTRHVLTADHVVAFRVGQPIPRKFDFSATLLDKAGKTVQNILSEEPVDRPASFALTSDAFLLLVENRVEAYR